MVLPGFTARAGLIKSRDHRSYRTRAALVLALKVAQLQSVLIRAHMDVHVQPTLAVSYPDYGSCHNIFTTLDYVNKTSELPVLRGL